MAWHLHACTSIVPTAHPPFQLIKEPGYKDTLVETLRATADPPNMIEVRTCWCETLRAPLAPRPCPPDMRDRETLSSDGPVCPPAPPTMIEDRPS